MMQIMVDDSVKKLIKDYKIWGDYIPSYVYNFIKDYDNNRVIFNEDNGEYYCSICYSKLDINYCNKCHKKYNIGSLNEITINKDMNVPNYLIWYKNDPEYQNSQTYEEEYYFYFFDVKNEYPLLYEIKETVYFYAITCFSYKTKVKVNNIYLVKEDRLININNNSFIMYKDIENNKQSESSFSESFDDIDGNNLLRCNGYLYPYNLYKLKNTIYKYTYIWNSIPFFGIDNEIWNGNNINLYNLTLLPLTNPCFEYLMKYRLLNLAFNSIDEIEFKKTFKETFGVSKKCLPLMQKIDIDYEELNLLKVLNIENEEMFMKVRDYVYETEPLQELRDKYNIDPLKVIGYFDSHNCKSYSVYEYRDYIVMCDKLKYNLSNKKVLFPNDLMKAHNDVLLQYDIIYNKDLEKDIVKMSNILSINKYEDDNYVIYPAPNLKSMLDEGYNQNNCLKTYCDNYSKGLTSIYFMRDKRKIDKSLVTIEVNKNKVVQARIKNNKIPDNNLMNIINKWERNLIPIEFN